VSLEELSYNIKGIVCGNYLLRDRIRFIVVVTEELYIKIEDCDGEGNLNIVIFLSAEVL
jgi:hypothetical protein